MTTTSIFFLEGGNYCNLLILFLFYNTQLYILLNPKKDFSTRKVKTCWKGISINMSNDCSLNFFGRQKMSFEW